MARKIIAFGAALVAIGIMIGAFGAHALKDVLDQHGKEIYEKAVFYHLIDALGIFGVGILCEIGVLGGKASTKIAAIFAVGILLFSGSLYLYAITQKTYWAMITPFGGISLIVGWLMLCAATLKRAPH